MLHCCTLISGLSQLLKELHDDFSSTPISLLVQRGTPPQLMCFREAIPLQDCLESYSILACEHHSVLFTNIWSAVTSQSMDSMTFSEVADKIWDPIFTKCAELIGSIQLGTILLREVDMHFCEFKQDRDTLCKHIKNLNLAIEECFKKVPNETEWINISVLKMEQYWILCEQAEAAKIVLTLKDSLNLTGDFLIIEKLAIEVTESMKNEPLNTISSSKPTSFLEQLKEEKLRSLQVFVNCSSIIEWIRNETTG